MRRRWIPLVILIAAVPVGWVLVTKLAGLRVRGELMLARQDAAQGHFDRARARLLRLTRARGGHAGEVDYLLGICESSLGHVDAALAAFSRVPAGVEFEPRAAYLEAGANLQRGRLRAAERRLVETLRRGGPGLREPRQLLTRVYEIQLRVEDSLPLYRESLDGTDEPFPLLQRICSLDGGTLPLESLRATLDEAARLAPDDDRVWLGRARLAILAGAWDEAEDWLQRCRRASPDAPVWRAWLLWARGAGRPADALEALRALGASPFRPSEAEEIRAWFARQADDARGERDAIRRWLALEPRSIPALHRAAELTQRLGTPAEADALRRAKTAADEALDRYRRRVRMGKAGDFMTNQSRLEVGRLAEAAGRGIDARAWYTLALRSDPGCDEARAAIERIGRELASNSEHAGGITAVALAAGLQGRVPRGPGGRPAAASRGVGLMFVERAPDAGLDFMYDNGESRVHQIPETTGGGIGLLDFDGDGWTDVYVVQGGPFPPARDRPGSGDRLFRNRNDGTFQDVTASAGLSRLPRGYGHGVAVADYDNDGRPDLFLTRWRSYVLLHNRGDNTFEDATERAGLGGDRDWPTSAAFADVDGDGDLDLYVCHYGVWDAENPRLCRDDATGAYISCNPLDLPARPDHLFRNDGGRFVDISAQAGIVDRDGRGLGVAAADFDGDGKVDFYVANDLTANYLWRNLGGWKFEEVGHAAGLAGNGQGGYQASMGVAPGDLNGDGRIDLAVTNFYGECTTFYRNLGGGVFSDGTAAAGLDVATRQLLGFGIVMFDADNDGHLDMASANGHVNDLRPHFPFLMPAQLLIGDGKGRLVDVSNRAGDVWKLPRMGRALAAGDLDNDGRVDLLLVSHNQPLAYLHNGSRAGHSVTFRLRGKPPGSSPDATGARVTVTSGGVKQSAWRFGGGSYQSSYDARIHFGLGAATHLDAVEVAWPSGRVDCYTGLAVDSGYVLVEGSGRPEPLPGFARPGRP